jgi:hypothetical protein
MEQRELWVLLTQGCQFPWHFRVKVASQVVVEIVEIHVPMCARKQDLLPNECQIMEPGAKWRLQGRGSGVLCFQSFFPFFLCLVASLFADLERALLLTVYETSWVSFGVL